MLGKRILVSSAQKPLFLSAQNAVCQEAHQYLRCGERRRHRGEADRRRDGQTEVRQRSAGLGVRTRRAPGCAWHSHPGEPTAFAPCPGRCLGAPGAGTARADPCRSARRPGHRRGSTPSHTRGNVQGSVLCTAPPACLTQTQRAGCPAGSLSRMLWESGLGLRAASPGSGAWGRAAVCHHGRVTLGRLSCSWVCRPHQQAGDLEPDPCSTAEFAFWDVNTIFPKTLRTALMTHRSGYARLRPGPGQGVLFYAEDPRRAGKTHPTRTSPVAGSSGLQTSLCRR